MKKLSYIRILGARAKKASQELSVLSETKKNAALKLFYLNIKKKFE